MNSLSNDPTMAATLELRPGRRGFTMIELLIVVAVMGILAGLVLPTLQPNLAQQVDSIAQVVAADLAYARNLAVTNNSQYQYTFASATNSYKLEHTGSNTALDALPSSPFPDYSDASDERITKIDDLPHVGPTPALVGAFSVQSSGTWQAETTLEFGPFGSTTRSETTVVLLKIGKGANLCYLPIEIDPVTGLVEIGDVTKSRPAKSFSSGPST